MTALLELKQKIKEIYGQYEMYILPVMKFVLALVYFLWINANMGYMSRLNNVFLVLILALICSILPSSAMMYIGFVLILVHSYALGIEIAAFMLVLILLMMIFFLRFSGEQNVTFVFTPLSFAFSLPALLPIGSGLMESSLSAIPAGCGVVMYYFIRFLRSQSTILVNPDLEMTDKLQIMADGLVQNWGMWIAVVAFVAVILLVHLILCADVGVFFVDVRRNRYSVLCSARSQRLERRCAAKHHSQRHRSCRDLLNSTHFEFHKTSS